MKRILAFLMIFCLCFTFSVSAFAEESEKETVEEAKADMSAPRLMVTSYSLDTADLTPGTDSVLKIIFQNYSSTKALKNIKLSISDDSGQIEVRGMGTKYVKSIPAGKSYVWSVKMTALPTATVGKYKLSVSSEYEDSNYSTYSSNDILTLNVKQTVALDHNGIVLPEKIVEGEIGTMEITLMNTGKTDLRNCKLTFKSDALESSGTTFVGELPVSESGTANVNYKPPLGNLGEVSATVEVSYEDAFGNVNTEEIKLSSVVEEQVVTATSPEKEKEKKNNLWWLFILIGAAVGGGLGFGIPTAIRNKKQRKEDNLRL